MSLLPPHSDVLLMKLAKEGKNELRKHEKKINTIRCLRFGHLHLPVEIADCTAQNNLSPTFGMKHCSVKMKKSFGVEAKKAKHFVFRLYTSNPLKKKPLQRKV